MTSRRLSLDEIKQLIGQPGHRVRLFTDVSFDPVCVGEIIGLAEHPTIIVRLEDGSQAHYVASLRMEVVPPLLPEPGDGTDLLGGEVVFSRRDGWEHSSAGKSWYSTIEDRYVPWTWSQVLDWAKKHDVLLALIGIVRPPLPHVAAVDQSVGGRVAVALSRNSCPSCYSFQRFSRVACPDLWHKENPDV